ncbi:MAG: hypothetical protein JNK82_34275 [Myxococcaceae bacterium]|nr:hypothetical protein [Myxococcaceae bacterium]
MGALDTVARNALTVEVDDLTVRIISLDELIQVKEHVRRPKDLEVAAELRAIRDALARK